MRNEAVNSVARIKAVKIWVSTSCMMENPTAKTSPVPIVRCWSSFLLKVTSLVFPSGDVGR